MGLKPLVVLEDSVVRQLMHSSAARLAFPFLVQITAAEKGKGRPCGTCSKKNRSNTTDYNAVRMRLAGLTPAGKNQLRAILGAEKLRVFYRNAAGQMTKATF